MSSVQCLRNFVSERLTAAAEEIVGVFIKTIVEYEEEIDRQRRLLDVVLKPEVRLHRIELPQQHVFTEEEVLSDQQLCDQERNSSLDQEDPADPPQTKEEHEELCTSQEREQLVLKLETDAFMSTPTYMESDHSESESKSDRQFLSDNWHVVQSQDQKGGMCGDSTPTTSAEPEPKKTHPKSRSQSIAVSKSNLSGTGHAMHTGKKKQYSCEACGKAFKFKSRLYVHMKTHTGEKPYPCNTCGKRFAQSENLGIHVRTHTGEKPFLCKTCGKDFARGTQMKIHVRKAHTGEKPYLCKICGKRYFEKGVLTRHMRIKH